MDNQNRSNRNDPFANPNHHHHLLGPPLTHHLPTDHHLKRPLPVSAHNGHSAKHPESPHGIGVPMPLLPGMSIPPPPSPSSSHHTMNHIHHMPSTSTSNSSADPSHLVEDYLQSQINKWRSSNMEMTELIGELLTVMPPEDQMQFMTGIMELIYKKRNNPEEEKQMRKYFLGGGGA